MAARRIIIDCDPGVDDAMAILLALASPELDVMALTPVAGNVGLDHTKVNALKICELAGRPDIPVYAGCDRPMLRKLRTASHIHGARGLGALDLPEPKRSLQPLHAVDYLIDAVRAADDGEITICAIGPVTNVALAIHRAPDIVPKLREIVVMGGTMSLGNITPSASFNLFVDPHAAHVVFTCGAPVAMVGLDVTMNVIASATRMAPIHAQTGRVADAVRKLNLSRNDNVPRYGSEDVPLPDTNVIAYLLKPELYVCKMANVEVDISSEMNMARTVVDWWDRLGKPKNTLVLNHPDADGVFALLAERLASYQ